jgi:hypothetical protein
MIWNRDQLAQMQALIFRKIVRDYGELHRFERYLGISDVEAARARREVVRVAHEKGLRVELEDIRVRVDHQSIDEHTTEFWITATWHPETHTAEVVYGSQDGLILEIEHIGAVIKVRVLHDIPNWRTDGPFPFDEGVDVDIIPMGPVGWDEDRHLWLYGDVSAVAPA